MPAVRQEVPRRGQDSTQRRFQAALYALQVEHLVGKKVKPEQVAGAVVRTGAADGTIYRQDFIKIGDLELPKHEVVVEVGGIQYPTPLFDRRQVNLAPGGERQVSLIVPVEESTPLGVLEGEALAPVIDLFRRNAVQEETSGRRAA